MTQPPVTGAAGVPRIPLPIARALLCAVGDDLRYVHIVARGGLVRGEATDGRWLLRIEWTALDAETVQDCAGSISRESLTEHVESRGWAPMEWAIGATFPDVDRVFQTARASATARPPTTLSLSLLTAVVQSLGALGLRPALEPAGLRWQAGAYAHRATRIDAPQPDRLGHGIVLWLAIVMPMGAAGDSPPVDTRLPPPTETP